jgi:drug/metabolite transporter (DMT)-like permease
VGLRFGQELHSVLGLPPRELILFLFFSAGPVLQGQRLVSPAAARIVFCSVPLFAALISAALLPSEAVGMTTWVGGAVVAAAGLVAALAPTVQEVEHGRQGDSSAITGT